MPPDRDILYDILESSHRIVAYLTDIDEAGFRQRVILQDAVIRRFEIVGEATKRLSADFRLRHDEIPWSDIAGMRDRIIHGYDTVDLQIVWYTGRHLLPGLIAQIEKILEDEARE